MEQSNPAQAKELAERTFQRLSDAARAKLKARERPAPSAADETAAREMAAREMAVQGAIDPNRVYSEEELLATDGTWKDAVGRQSGYELQDAAASTANTSKIPMMGIPDEKLNVLGLQGQNWPNWYKEVTRLPGVTAPETNRYMEIYAWEGGEAESAGTRDFSGITPDVMDRAVKAGAVPGSLSGKSPIDTSQAQRAAMYRYYFDDVLRTVDRTVPGSRVLDRIADERLGKAFADTLFAHGRRGGTEILQRALGRVNPDFTGVDGQMGPTTFAAFRAATDDPARRRALLDAVRDARIDYAKRNYPAKDLKGWESRANHFAF